MASQARNKTEVLALINQKAAQAPNHVEMTKNLLAKKGLAANVAHEIVSSGSRVDANRDLDLKRDFPKDQDSRSVHSEFDYRKNKDLTGFIKK